MEKTGSESANVRANKKVSLLHQSLLIQNWIHNFDPKGLNDCFDQTAEQIPPSLRQLEPAIENSLNRISLQKLSPHNSRISHAMRTHSQFVLKKQRQQLNSPSVTQSLDVSQAKIKRPFLKGARMQTLNQSSGLKNFSRDLSP